MKHSASGLLILVLCLAGCGVTPAKYTFEATYPETKHVTFHFTTTQEKNDTTVLQGSLFHKPFRHVRESGHVDIAVYSPAGELVLQTTADYQTPINPTYAWSKTGVRFLAPLSLVPPPGSTIKMAFHVDKQWPKTREPHGANIAL